MLQWIVPSGSSALQLELDSEHFLIFFVRPSNLLRMLWLEQNYPSCIVEVCFVASPVMLMTLLQNILGYPLCILGIWCWTLSYALPEAIVVLTLLLNLLICSNHLYLMMYRRNILPNHQILLVQGPQEMIHDLQSCHDNSISSIVSLEPPCMP